MTTLERCSKCKSRSDTLLLPDNCRDGEPHHWQVVSISIDACPKCEEAQFDGHDCIASLHARLKRLEGSVPSAPLPRLIEARTDGVRVRIDEILTPDEVQDFAVLIVSLSMVNARLHKEST